MKHNGISMFLNNKRCKNAFSVANFVHLFLWQKNANLKSFFCALTSSLSHTKIPQRNKKKVQNKVMLPPPLVP